MRKKSKMGNVSIDIDSAVLNAGYHPTKDLARNERHRVFIAQKGANKVVVKATAVPVEINNLRTEALAHQMLRGLAPGGGRFTFPETEILEDGVVFVSMSPYISKGWLATSNPLRFVRKITDRDLEDIFQAMLFLHSLKKSELTPHFQKAGKEFTLSERLERHANYLKPAIGSLCTTKEAEALVSMMKEVGYKRRFVHHDMLPPNIARLSAKKILIADAEFARWEMKWYDVAYSFMQIAILYEKPAMAKRWLTYFVRRFKEELPNEDIEREIFFPLGYWMGATLFIAMREPQKKRAAKAMLKKVLAQDLGLLMR